MLSKQMIYMSGSATIILLVCLGHGEGIQPQRFRHCVELLPLALGKCHAEALQDRSAAEARSVAARAGMLRQPATAGARTDHRTEFL